MPAWAVVAVIPACPVSVVEVQSREAASAAEPGADDPGEQDARAFGGAPLRARASSDAGRRRPRGPGLVAHAISLPVKQVRVPVWQAGPVWSTCSRTVSPSQSTATETTAWRWPDVSPLTQYSPRLRDQ